DLRYPYGFTPSMINVEEVNKKVKGARSNEVNEHVSSTSNKLEDFVPKGKLLSNNSVCLKRVHTDSSILQLMDELVKGFDKMVEDTWKSLATVDSNGGSNEEILSDRSLLLKELNDINSIDSLEAPQKSKVCWAIEGDENTKLFHGY
nr:RNA-directed DNA polymerase, eukaryota [Tanacetum cinerariifolium]